MEESRGCCGGCRLHLPHRSCARHHDHHVRNRYYCYLRLLELCPAIAEAASRMLPSQLLHLLFPQQQTKPQKQK